MNVDFTTGGIKKRLTVEDMIAMDKPMAICRFDSNNTDYIFQVCPGLNAGPGDYVVVQCTNGLQVCQVFSTDVDYIRSVNNKHQSPITISASVIAVIDFTAWQTYKDRQEKQEALMRKMLLRKKELEGIYGLELLAATDPAMAEMLKDFKALEK